MLVPRGKVDDGDANLVVAVAPVVDHATLDGEAPVLDADGCRVVCPSGRRGAAGGFGDLTVQLRHGHSNAAMSAARKARVQPAAAITVAAR